MTSCRSHNWCTLMTFQRQESWIHTTKIALWSTVLVGCYGSPRRLNLVEHKVSDHLDCRELL